MKQGDSNRCISRRRFFQSLMLAVSSGVLGSAVASNSKQSQQPSQSEDLKPNQGYQETSHIRQYYQSISRC